MLRFLLLRWTTGTSGLQAGVVVFIFMTNRGDCHEDRILCSMDCLSSRTVPFAFWGHGTAISINIPTRNETRDSCPGYFLVEP